MFNKYIHDGDAVIDVGGHIGYMTLIFSKLVGKSGKVFAFEPGLNNLPYIRKNIENKENIILIEKGAGDENTMAVFFIDNLTGQNNSFVEDFDVFKNNKALSFDVDAGLTKVNVPIITLDSLLDSESLSNINFIKIDVEGFELEVLRGSKKIIDKFHPNIMVEVQRNQGLIADFLLQNGYKLYNEMGVELDKRGVESLGCNNLFAICR